MARQRTMSEQAGAAYPASSQETIEKYPRVSNLLECYQRGQIGLLQLIQGIARNMSF